LRGALEWHRQGVAFADAPQPSLRAGRLNQARC
jgi:hypothetical protein